MQDATSNMQHATCYMQHASCNLQHATCCMHLIDNRRRAITGEYSAERNDGDLTRARCARWDAEHAHPCVGIVERRNDAQVPQSGQLRDLRRDRREIIGAKIPAVPRRSAPIRTHASAREAKNRPAHAHTSAMPILANVGDSRPHQHDKAPLSYD